MATTEHNKAKMKTLIVMDHIEKKERLDYLLELLKKGRSNTLKEIALRFDISQRTSKRMIATLRDMAYQITYSKFSKKYFFDVFWITQIPTPLKRSLLQGGKNPNQSQ